jgi:hypothetical protein
MARQRLEFLVAASYPMHTSFLGKLIALSIVVPLTMMNFALSLFLKLSYLVSV